MREGNIFSLSTLAEGGVNRPRSGGGVLHPRSRRGGGVPHPRSRRGVLHPRSGQRGYPIQDQNGGGGYPGVPSHSGLDGVPPPIKTEWGYPPPIQDWMVYHPPSQDWMGYSLPSITGWGTPPPCRRLDGVHPPFPPSPNFPLSGDRSAKRALATQRAVCLLHSRRRTVIVKYRILVSAHGNPDHSILWP